MKNAAAKLQYRVTRHEPFHSLVMSMCRYGVLIFAMLAIAGSAHAQPSCDNPSSGDGVVVPYAIKNIAQLQAITSGSMGNYVLCNSINATGTGFVPIGGTEGFSGTFDGNDMTIRNLTISLPSSSRVGLFGKLSTGGKIQNLKLVDVEVTGIDQVGGLVGESLGNIEGVSVTGTVTGHHQVGGLVGAFSNAILSVCKSDVIVRPISPTAEDAAEEYLGGLVGQLSTATVSRCSATGNLVVSGQGQRRKLLTERIVGGLIGFAQNSSVQNSTATGQINAGAGTAGGLIGRAISAVISESHASGTVTASRNAGGLIGILGQERGTELPVRKSTVLNSYSTGDVELPLTGQVIGKRAGGLISELQENWLVRNSYATGGDESPGGAEFGGLLGLVFGTGSVLNSFATGSTEHKFIYYLKDPKKLTSSGNYYLEAPGIQDVEPGVTRVLLDQLECPTTPGTVCGGGVVPPFVEWDQDIWNFGAATELPVLTQVPIPTSPTSGCPEAEMSYAEGSGEEDSPYKVDTVCRLQAVQNALSAHYELVADLNATEANLWNDGMGFIPIGDGDVGFSGIFNGNGMTISNLIVNRPAVSGVGLFGKLSPGGKIQNLNLEDVKITGMNQVGGLAGYSGGTISGFTVTGVVVGGQEVGGVVGTLGEGATVENGLVKETVSAAGNYAGGLVGRMENSTVQASIAIAQVSAAGNYAGGLVGGMGKGAMVKNSVATGDVSTAENYAGGLVGEMGKGAAVKNSVATGDVSAAGFSANAGGLVSRVGEGAIVENSVATGDVSSTGNLTETESRAYAGGLTGWTEGGSTVRFSYATGQVESSWTAGGLAGRVDAGSVINNTFATGTVKATQNRGGLVGLRQTRPGTLNDHNYCVSEPGNSGVGEQRELGQLTCPTTPGTVCGGVSVAPFENWDSNIWDFGNAEQLPQLVGLPRASTVQITVEVSGGTLGFTADATPTVIPVTASVRLDPAPDRNSTLRIILTKTSGSVPVCRSDSDTGCVYLIIGNKRTNEATVLAGTSAVRLALSLGIAGEIALSLTGEFELDVRLQGYINEGSGNELPLNFQQGNATVQPEAPESASLRMRVLLGGAVR